MEVQLEGHFCAQRNSAFTLVWRLFLRNKDDASPEFLRPLQKKKEKKIPGIAFSNIQVAQNNR